MTNNEAYKIPEVIECVGYESLGSTEIRLDGLDSFIENAKDYKIDKIWSCYAPLCNKFKTVDGKFPDFERMNPYAEIFFFVVNNVIYSVESLGYRSLYDYINAKNMGFLDPSVYSLMAEVTKKYKVESVASLYYKAVKDGFKNLEDFADSFNFYDDYESFSTYQEEHYLSAELGFKKKYDSKIAESKGFKNGMEYYDAIALDIDNACKYHDYRLLSEVKSKYGFQTAFEFHIFHIINRLRGGQTIKLRDMVAKLRYEASHYNKEWYGQNWHEITEDLVERILNGNSKFSKIGKLTKNSGFFEYSIFRNNTIYVDGSNVAWNDGNRKNGDLPYANNVRIVIKELKKIGFKEILVLCDNNFYNEIPDKEIYQDLSRERCLYLVQKGNVADDWLLRFGENKDCFIVTNDKYRDYWEKYSDVRKHLIKFKVLGDEARFDKKIYKVVDGILSKDELPSLCYQYKDV